jgi:hypothetical protein
MKWKEPWTNAAKRLKRKAKKEGWIAVWYYDCGYRYGYLKTQGRKWAHLVVLVYRDGKYQPIVKKYRHPVTLEKLN